MIAIKETSSTACPPPALSLLPSSREDVGCFIRWTDGRLSYLKHYRITETLAQRRSESKIVSTARECITVRAKF